jgi:hypothetical protein
VKTELCVLSALSRDDNGKALDAFFTRLTIRWNEPRPIFQIRITNAEVAKELAVGHTYKVRLSDDGLTFQIDEVK